MYSRERSKPAVRFRRAVTVQVAQGSDKPAKKKSSKKKGSTPTTVSAIVVVGGPERLALSPATRLAALRGDHLSDHAPTISFGAKMSADPRFLNLTVTAPNRNLATTVAASWGRAFTVARRENAASQILRSKRALSNQVNRLHDELLRVDATLAKLMPLIYGVVLRYDQPNGNVPSSRTQGNGQPSVPEGGSVYVLNLALERTQLLTQITDLATRVARLNVTSATPEAFAQVVSQSPAVRATKSRSTTLPAAAGLLGGLFLAMAAAVAVDRTDRRIRDPRVAAASFGAPVLSLLGSADEGDYVLLSDPSSFTAEAYRALAATSIATDRLPKAIMVTSPYGTAHEEVAANFAAALATFGLKTVLIGTSPDQAWYSERLETSGVEARTFPELLAAAHEGTFSGELRDQLPTSDRAPNLRVVPPAGDGPMRLHIDGLPRLLAALADSGVDVTVISGPALLEEADATIVAWGRRSVLWAIAEGEITAPDARAAAARLELAGVNPFGVVMVGRYRAEI